MKNQINIKWKKKNKEIKPGMMEVIKWECLKRPKFAFFCDNNQEDGSLHSSRLRIT